MLAAGWDAADAGFGTRVCSKPTRLTEAMQAPRQAAGYWRLVIVQVSICAVVCCTFGGVRWVMEDKVSQAGRS